LLAGDIWAKDAFRSGVLEKTLRAHGFGGYPVAGSLTCAAYAIAGKWALNKYHELDTLTQALQRFSEVEIVHLSLGTGDILDFGTDSSLNAMSSATLEKNIANIQTALQTIVDTILAVRPTLQVVLVDGDYLDPALLKAAHGKEWPLKQVSQRRLNDILVMLGRKKLEIAQRTDRCFYVQNWGVLQYRLGNAGAPFPGGPDANFTPYPGGNPDYPSPSAAFLNQDGWRLNDQANTWIFENCLDQFYAAHLAPDQVEGEGSEGEGEGAEGEGEGSEGEGEGEEGEGEGSEGEGEGSEGEGEGEGAEGEGEGEGAEGEGEGSEGEGEGEGAEGEGEGETEGDGEGASHDVVEITPTPGSVVLFGGTLIGSTAEEAIRIQNVSDATVSGQVHFLTGAVFSVVGDGAFQLQPGATRVLIVRFTPTAAHSYIDTLFINDGESTHLLLLNGTGASSTFSCNGQSTTGTTDLTVISNVLILIFTVARLLLGAGASS
jgi:hypothetical protein